MNQVDRQSQFTVSSASDMPYEAWFQPFGFVLRIASNSQPILDAADRSFGRFGRPAQTDRPDFTFRLVQDDRRFSVSERPTYHEEGGLVYQTCGPGVGLVANRDRGLVTGRFPAALLADQPFFRSQFLELAFFTMLAPRGLMGVHGAALARNGRAALLRAPSGGGKTTLAYAGARRDFQALAEDVVWLDVERGRWWGLPWFFHLLPEAKSLFPELAAYQPVLQTNQEWKLEVDLAAIRPNSVTPWAKPGPVLLLERRPGERSRLVPLSLAEARPEWLAGQAGAETSFPDYHHHLDRLLDGNTYRLYFGDDIDAALDLLARLLD